MVNVRAGFELSLLQFELFLSVWSYTPGHVCFVDISISQLDDEGSVMLEGVCLYTPGVAEMGVGADLAVQMDPSWPRARRGHLHEQQGDSSLRATPGGHLASPHKPLCHYHRWGLISPLLKCLHGFVCEGCGCVCPCLYVCALHVCVCECERYNMCECVLECVLVWLFIRVPVHACVCIRVCVFVTGASTWTLPSIPLSPSAPLLTVFMSVWLPFDTQTVPKTPS